MGNTRTYLRRYQREHARKEMSKKYNRRLSHREFNRIRRKELEDRKCQLEDRKCQLKDRQIKQEMEQYYEEEQIVLDCINIAMEKCHMYDDDDYERWELHREIYYDD